MAEPTHDRPGGRQPATPKQSVAERGVERNKGFRRWTGCGRRSRRLARRPTILDIAGVTNPVPEPGWTSMVTHHFTVDVEEYFHPTALAPYYPEAEWDGLERRSPLVIPRLLELHRIHQ